MKDHILVIGGTGKTGRKVVNLLQEQGQVVRVGSRQASPAFDWHRPDTWEQALDGITKVYVTYQPDLAVPGAMEAIEGLVRIAQRKQIQQMVLLSGKGEREAELCEQVLIHSGIDYTIVRASWFNQNFSESFMVEPILAGEVALPQGKVPVPFVDTDDIAAVVVAALSDKRHLGQIYHLTGPKSISFEEAVEVIAEATGRTLNFHHLSLDEYAQILKEVGLPDDYAWLINYLFKEVLGNPAVSEVSNDIQKVLGRPAKTFEQYVQETVPSGVWPTAEIA